MDPSKSAKSPQQRKGTSECFERLGREGEAAGWASEVVRLEQKMEALVPAVP